MCWRFFPLLAWPCLALAGENAAGPAAAEPFARYEAMLAHSPFAPPSESAPADNRAGFAKDLLLTGVVRFNGGAYVLLASRDQSLRLALKTGETANGLAIAGIAWSETPGKTRVTLRRGDEIGVVGFDEAAASAPPVASNAPPDAAAAQAAPRPPFAPPLPLRRRFFQ
ncbi:MAG: hypothetical protein WCH57_07280 [Verrucomicrobiota bacterium]